MNYGKAIKEIRKSKGLKQEYVCYKAGMTQTGLSFIETGKRSPNNESLEKLARALEVPIGYIILKAINWEKTTYSSDSQRVAAEKNVPVINKLMEEIITS